MRQSVAAIFVLMALATHGHVLREDLIKTVLSRKVPFDSQSVVSNENVTYYSYHIHVYFLQNNVNQTDEATTLRNRFLERYNVGDCNNDCETWCPRICHWELNMAPIGYFYSLLESSSVDFILLDHIRLDLGEFIFHSNFLLMLFHLFQ